MDTGIYVALSKEIGTLRDLDVTANNIANATTTGFESDSLLFTDYLASTTPQEDRVAFANDISTYRNTGQGSMQITGNALDAAIEGAGYFVVQTPLGPRYTRNGNFRINGDGNLVNADGYAVVDESNQPITFDPLDKVIQIRDDGTINVDLTDRATLKIVQFDNPQLMRRVGKSLYSAEAAPKPPQDFRVLGGVLERSNVEPFTELTHMMYISRSIEGTNKLISTIYTLEQKASDTLAKIYS
jgi:flagellar basal-body rod protein FlgF